MADRVASHRREAHAAKADHRFPPRQQFSATNLGCATGPALVLRFAVNPHGAGKKLSVLMASRNDLIKRNRDFENNKRDDSEFQTRKASIGCPIWQHADCYSRILGKSITRTSPFWLVNVSVWSALCACATPEMR
jgi:hypothetical protein